MLSFSLEDLEQLLEQRQESSIGQSYTKALLEAGVGQISKKFGEEAVETIIAALTQDKQAFIHEVADVLYHLLVLLKVQQVSVAEIMKELQRRTKESGLAEKSGRKKEA